jgi:hypothetical protein
LRNIASVKTYFLSFLRWAARNSQQSSVWSEVLFTLTRTFPTLFDSFANQDDAQFHLISCAESPVSLEYVNLIAKSYQRQVDLFKTNVSQIYTALEKLLFQNNIKEAERFMRDVIVTHFSLITNLEELLQMLIRACSSVSIESRTEFCHEIIAPISYELSKKKSNKKLAGIFFDLILAILDLNVIEAPECACRILAISDFYTWKQLDKQLTHLVQSCIAYDQLVIDSYFSPLDSLEDIVKIIHERVKSNPTILHATHETALQAIFKWSSIINDKTGKTYGRHVFKLGQKMTDIIDPRQITVDICRQLFEILQKRLDNNDEPCDLDQVHDHFFNVSLLINKHQISSIFFVAYC